MSAGPPSVPSVFAARFTTPMTANHTQSDPDESPDQRNQERVQPKRPGETPEEEVDLHVLGVLDREDEQHSDSCEPGDCPCTEPTPGFLCRTVSAVTRNLLSHDSFSLHTYKTASDHVRPDPGGRSSC